METYSGREAIPAEGTLNITGFEEEDKSPVVKSLQSPEEMGSGYFGRATKSPGTEKAFGTEAHLGNASHLKGLRAR